MPFDLNSMFAQMNANRTQDPNGVPSFLQPNASPQIVAMNMPRVPGDDPSAMSLDQPPPVQAAIKQKAPAPIVPPPQAAPTTAPSDESADESSELDQYKVTPEELQDARDAKRRALMIGAIASPLANRQSFGNFYTGHMNQAVDTMGPAKTAAELADQGIKDKNTLMKQAVDQPKNSLQMLQSAQQEQQAKDMNTPGSPMAMLNASITSRVAGKAGVPIDEKQLAGMTFLQQQETINKNPVLADAIKEDSEAKRLQSMMMRMQASQGIQERRLNLQGEKFAASAGKDVEKAVLPYKNILNSLNKSESILNKPGPITATDMNVAQQDYINSVAAGGAATEGKTNREMVNDFPMLLNHFQQKFGKQADIRTQDPELYEHLKSMIANVKGDINGQMMLQQQATVGNYAASQNQKVQDTIAGKNKLYGQGYQPGSANSKQTSPQMDPQDAEALTWAKQNPGNPDAAGILVKISRKYKGASGAI